jgi:hypothetical protein
VYVLAIITSLASLSPLAKSAIRPALQTDKEAASPPGLERAIKGFLYALYSSDAVEYQKWILPEPGSNELIAAQRLAPTELEELRREVEGIQLRQTSPFVVDGKESSGAPDGRHPVGTKITYMTGFRGSAIAIPVVFAESGWKVDVRFWVAAKKQAEGGLKQTDPEATAKAFLYYLLAKRPEKLGGLSASRINAEEYTSANHLPGGDLDQVLSLCIEMPIVRARMGESFIMPSGEIVKAGNQTDTLVLVGLLGTVEVAFQVKQVGGEWKVVPQKYFEMLRRVGAI